MYLSIIFKVTNQISQFLTLISNVKYQFKCNQIVMLIIPFVINFVLNYKNYSYWLSQISVYLSIMVTVILHV